MRKIISFTLSIVKILFLVFAVISGVYLLYISAFGILCLTAMQEITEETKMIQGISMAFLPAFRFIFKIFIGSILTFVSINIISTVKSVIGVRFLSILSMITAMVSFIYTLIIPNFIKNAFNLSIIRGLNLVIFDMVWLIITIVCIVSLIAVKVKTVHSAKQLEVSDTSLFDVA